MVVVGGWLDLMILVFSNLGDSVSLWFYVKYCFQVWYFCLKQAHHYRYLISEISENIDENKNESFRMFCLASSKWQQL